MRPLALSRLVIRLTPGQEWGALQAGWFCLPGSKLTWKSGQQDIRNVEYLDAFRDGMRQAGFQVEGDPDNLFEGPVSVSDYEVAGVVTNINVHACLSNTGSGADGVKGSITLDMEWQVYSTLRKAVIGKTKTEAVFEIKSTVAGGLDALMLGAFRANVKNLAADQGFRTMFADVPLAPGDRLKPSSQAPIPLIGAIAAGPRSIADAAASVVVIFAGNGLGSGFLVSSDGLLFTDQHVVGDSKYVKVRWPDGIEGLGEVIRTDKVRDVALLKTDPRGRKPLGLRRDPPQVGDAVFAIGAPLDAKFQSTVTRGVVSANRTFQGLGYLQSDANVQPGDSGGPLLDEKGAVVAITESGYSIGGAPEGINLFTPVGDALDFLGAQPR